MRSLLGLAIGGSLGAFIGWKGRCETGACPLMSNPYIGGIYGALLGALFAGLLSCSSQPAVRQSSEGSKAKVATQVTQSNIINLGSERDFGKTVQESAVPVLVDFWAAWCGPCRMQGPILEQLANQQGDRVRIVKVNVDDMEALARQFDIRGIPTLIVFDQGKEKNRLIGVQSLDTLKKALAL